MILVYLHNTQMSWVMLDEKNHIQQTRVRANLIELTPWVKNHDVYVIVPAQDVLLTSVELPKLNRQRLLQALPFALEEQLIDDVSQLHFAIGDYPVGHPVPVAVVAKQKIDSWLTLFNAAGIVPTAFIPATLLLPCTPNEWHVSIFDEVATIRTGPYSGIACDKNNLNKLLELKLAETEQKPSCIYLYHLTEQPVSLHLENKIVNPIACSEKQLLENCAQWIRLYPYINLLQATYRAKPPTTQTKKIWLVACYLTAAWIGTAFFSNIFSLLILHHHTSKTEQAIHQIYRRHFPQATSVVEPQLRMEEQLKKISAQVNKNYFLNMLGFIGNSLVKIPGIRLQTMEYHDNQLNVAVSAATFDNLDAFIQALTQQGLRVKQQNAGMVGTQIKANLLIQT